MRPASTRVGFPELSQILAEATRPVLFAISFVTFAAQAQSIYSDAYSFTTVAGLASTGNADGVGTAAQFDYPDCTAVDPAGNIYVADTLNHTIRKITPAGVVTTFAGFPGNGGTNDGTGGAARFLLPQGVAVGGSNTIFVADTGNNTIRMITSAGVVTTIAGQAGISGTNDGALSLAQFNKPERLAVDLSGNIYVADSENFTIREITIDGLVSTLAGLAGQAGTNDGVGSLARFSNPEGIALDAAGNLYVTDSTNATIRQLTQTGAHWTVSTIAGAPGISSMVNGLGSSARFNRPRGIAADGAGNLFVTDSANNLVRELSPSGTNWTVSTFAGRYGAYGNAGGTGTNAVFYEPRGVSVDHQGNLYVADVFSSTIRRVTSAAVVDNVAGAAHSNGYSDGTGSEARFNLPYGLALDAAGNIYVADTYSHVIRKITPAGLVTTMAGQEEHLGFNDGAGTLAQFYYPKAVAVDTNGNVYVADTSNDTIRRVTPAGVVSTIAGAALVPGSNDGLGKSARFNGPRGVAVDTFGNLFVADSFNNTIREMTPAGTNWMVTTLAGRAAIAGTNDGVGTNALFSFPTGVAPDGLGNLYVADNQNFTIRKLTPVGTNWMVSTIAGSPGIQDTADGTNSAAHFYDPFGIAVDGYGSVYVGDGNADVIRKLVPVGTNWNVNTIAGLALVQGSADAAGKAARFAFPAQLAVDGSGNLFVADTGNDTIRKGTFSAYAGTLSPIFAPFPAGAGVSVVLFPPEAGGQWRFPWELAWHESGDVVSNLTVGNYSIEFRSVPGYLTVATNFIVALPAGKITCVTNVYYPTSTNEDSATPGTLTVNIGPGLVAGTGWRFFGETNWRPAGSTATNQADIYFIEFEPLNGYSKPASKAVQIYPGLNTVVSAGYSLAQPPPPAVLRPFPVPVANIGDLTNYPFGYDGQLQSDVGFGSGVAVETNIVLTAAHMVFDDQTLSYVSHVYWYWQQENAVYQPEPMSARGWYMLSGYAAERTNDLTSGLVGVDQSTPQSRNQDVAALYFNAPAAGGGHAGYLPSDATPNPWLTGTSLKMLVGYPVDGSIFGDASIVPGVMYQTDPQPYPLNLSSDPLTDQQIYTASWFLSYPGNSGGPLYVKYNGYFYPAAVYVGVLYNGVIPIASTVRAIDSDVVNLINLAQTQGDIGTNNPGGGVITIVPNAGVSAAHPGYIQWNLQPPAAVRAGAAWRLAGDPDFSGPGKTNYTRAVLTTNSVSVEFKAIPGWYAPAGQPVSVVPDQVTPYTAFYTVTNPVLVASPALGLALTGTTGTTYRIESRTSLTSGDWQPMSTNTITTTGLNLVLPPPAANQPATFYRAVWLP